MSSRRTLRRGLLPLWTAPLVLIAVAAAVLATVVIAGRGGGDGAPTPAVLGELGAPPDLRNGRAFTQTNLWVDGEERYAVWVDDAGAAFAGRRDGDGTWSTVDLGTVGGNPLALPTADDEHNTYVVGVDANGDVHVFGNMHSDELRYARTTRPGDLTSFVSGTLPRADERSTYPQLVALPDGTLLLFRRIGVPGDGEIVLSRLAPGAAAWGDAGTVLDGRPTGENPYLHDVAVDPVTGAVHLLVTWRAAGGEDSTNDVTYLRSTDSGTTWTTSDGRRLTAPVTHHTVEMVIDTEPIGSGLLNGGGFTLDPNGNPLGVVTFRAPPSRRQVLVRHDPAAGGWSVDEVDATDLSGRLELVAAGGQEWLIGLRGTTVVAVRLVDGERRGAVEIIRPVPRGWEPFVDSNGARDGAVELLLPSGDKPLIVVLRIEEKT